MIKLKRVYDPPDETDGCRVLVDRIWPRGLSKADARVDKWLKDVAPTTGLRKWFAHDPAKWDEFRARYARELDQHGDAVRELRALSRGRTVTLLFAAKDSEHSNAAALKDYLAARR